MRDGSQYLSDGVQRTLRALLVLGANFQGLRLMEVAKALNTAAPNALRSLENLRAAGLAERDPIHEDTWFLGPRVVQIGLAFETHAADATNKLSERHRRYTRQP